MPGTNKGSRRDREHSYNPYECRLSVDKHSQQNKTNLLSINSSILMLSGTFVRVSEWSFTKKRDVPS